jgi:hypothetical protein
MAKESKATQEDVKRAMHKRKEGTLKSGRSGRTVKSKKQAIAIGLSEARAKGKRFRRRSILSRRSANSYATAELQSRTPTIALARSYSRARQRNSPSRPERRRAQPRLL